LRVTLISENYKGDLEPVREVNHWLEWLMIQEATRFGGRHVDQRKSRSL